MVPNQIIPLLAANQFAADAWVAASLLVFFPTTPIRFLLIGNEILSDASIANSTWPSLVPVIRNLHRSVWSRGIRNIKLGTTLAMDALAVSFPLFAGVFRPDVAEPVLRSLLDFLTRIRFFYFVDAYPYFTWVQNWASIPLDYALFQGGPGSAYVNPGTRLIYTNLLDQMLDAVVAAMCRMGYPSIPIAMAKTGWPNAGDLDQIGANVHNAATYNRNLARRMAARPPPETPAQPGVEMPVFVFSLFNEDQKPRPGTERHCGLFYPNGTSVYEVDLTGRRPAETYPPLPQAQNNTP